MAIIFPHAVPPGGQSTEVGRWVVSTASELGGVRRALTASADAGDVDRGAADGPGAPGSGSGSGSRAPRPGVASVMARTSERLALVFSELASNALRHAAPPVVVLLSRTEDGWRVSVDDGGDEGPAVRALDHSTPGGNGLHLVLTLADHAGWHARGTGKRVWADVHHEPPEHLLGRLP